MSSIFTCDSYYILISLIRAGKCITAITSIYIANFLPDYVNFPAIIFISLSSSYDVPANGS